MMIKVGVLGLGKLGLPISVAMSTVHDVMGYDLNPNLNKIRSYEHLEQGFYQDTEFQEVFDRTSLKFANSLEELVNHSSIIFVAVQTPHEAHLDGSVRFTYSQAKDFDYTYLIKACRDLAPLVKPEQTVAIISTVLPGTITRHIVPILGKKCKLVYNPYFIAMGTVLRDFNDPEFILLGGKEEELRNILDFYSSYYDSWSGWCPPVKIMSYESAELTKVAYNTLISSKIVAINAVAEMAHGIQGCNIDDVSDALEASCKRLSSRRYMRGGLGDSGACFTADTKISLLNSKEVPIKELVGLKEFYVYSYDVWNDQVTVGRAHSCRRTGKKRRVLEVELDNGETIRCTSNHPFLLRRGVYRIAGELKVGNRLMPLCRRDSGGYEKIYNPINKTKELTHRMVHRWKYGDLPALPIVHHKDFNKRNNEPSNITAVSSGGHSSYHNARPEKKAQQSALMRRLIKQGRINNEEHRKNTTRRNLTNNPMKDPETKKKVSKAMKVIMRGRVADGTHHTVTNNPAYKLMEEGRHNFQTDHPMWDDAKREHVKQAHNERHAREAGFDSHADSVAVICRLFYKEGLSVKEIMKRLGLGKRFVYYRINEEANHTVVAVRDAGMEDVYNFEVDKYENYALSSGVFVHNCHPRDCIAMSFLSERLGLSYNLYNELLWARELQACKIASLFKYHAGDLPKIILGKAFKEESNITTGSCALLIADILRHDGVPLAGHWDPLIDGDFPDGLNIQETPTAFLVATKHKMFNSLRFGRGSVVIDPFRYIKDQDGVKIIRFGVGK